MKNLILILIIAIAGSCVTQRKCNQKFPVTTSERDSVYIEKIKLVPVSVPGDTLNVSSIINCPDQDIISVENKRLKQQISILNGKLISSTQIKPDTIKVPVKEIQIVTNEVRVPEPVKYIPKIYKQALSICIFIFAVAFTWMGWKVYSFFK